jgi:hypothetical protein
VLDRAREDLDPRDWPHRADGGDLRARLLAGADDCERVRIRIGQQLGRNPARRPVRICPNRSASIIAMSLPSSEE